MILSFFSCTCWPSVFIFWKNIQNLCPYFNQTVFWILSSMNSLYILYTIPLLVILFVNIFSHSVGDFHFINGFLGCAKVVLVWYSPQFGSVTQSYLTLCEPTDGSQPGSSVHGILQARRLEWVAIPFFRGSSRPRADQTQVSWIAGRLFTSWATREYVRGKVVLPQTRKDGIREETLQKQLHTTQLKVCF